jgi:hypothetical protein
VQGIESKSTLKTELKNSSGCVSEKSLKRHTRGMFSEFGIETETFADLAGDAYTDDGGGISREQ